MPQRRTKALNRGKANRKQMHRNRAAKRNRGASSRARVQVKYRGPRISRARLQNVREDLQGTKNAVTEIVDKFWIIPEGEIRETLAQTEKKIRRAVATLQKAA
jgi:hypothetical protein